jgi:hypothetical protein
MLENNVLRRIYRPKREEVIKMWEITSTRIYNIRKYWESSFLEDERLLKNKY